MSYTVQLLTEATMGKTNIQQWILEEVSEIAQEDLDLIQTRALAFISEPSESLEAIARVSELLYHFDSPEACAEAITTAVLQAVIAIKPEYLIRGGREVAFSGVAPIQAIATQIGLHLHHDQLDAVSTGMEILADFADIGIYDLHFGTDEHGHDTAVVRSNFSDIEKLQSRIKAVRFLPPMVVAPLELI